MLIDKLHDAQIEIIEQYLESIRQNYPYDDPIDLDALDRGSLTTIFESMKLFPVVEFMLSDRPLSGSYERMTDKQIRRFVYENRESLASEIIAHKERKAIWDEKRLMELSPNQFKQVLFELLGEAKGKGLI